MSQLAADTFTRANTTASTNVATGWGTASDGETWSQANGNGTFQISSNEGTITNTTSANNVYLGTNTAQDAEVLCRFETTAIAADVGLDLRADATAANLYRARIKSSTFTIRKLISSTPTDLATASFTEVVSTFYWIRFRVKGSNLFAKIWADGSSEPAAWTLTATDTSLTGANRYGVFTSPTGAAQVVSYDHFTVTDLSTKTLQTRLILRTQNTLTAATRTIVRVQPTLTAPVRAILRTLNTKTLPTRTILRTQPTKTVQVRLVMKQNALLVPVRCVLVLPIELTTVVARGRDGLTVARGH